MNPRTSDPSGAGSTEGVVELADGACVGLRRWPGRGVPLVLLHGFLDSSGGWEALAGENGHGCYAFDLPGFGCSVSDLCAVPR